MPRSLPAQGAWTGNLSLGNPVSRPSTEKLAIGDIIPRATRSSRSLPPFDQTVKAPVLGPSKVGADTRRSPISATGQGRAHARTLPRFHIRLI